MIAAKASHQNHDRLGSRFLTQGTGNASAYTSLLPRSFPYLSLLCATRSSSFCCCSLSSLSLRCVTPATSLTSSSP